MAMTLDQALAALEALGTEKMRAFNRKNGADGPQFGCKMGDIRAVAAKIKVDHPLGLQLWASGNLDARLLAVLVMKPALLSAEQVAAMIQDATLPQLADWFNGYVLKLHPEKETLRLRWLDATDPMLQRSAWSLTNERILKAREGLDLPALLARIEKEAGSAPQAAQWTMNFCLAAIGIHAPDLRDRAVGVGETLGMYRDYPVSKGCTSPFAPLWIAEMVRRQDQQQSA